MFVVTMIIFFRNVMPCSLVILYQRLEMIPALLSGILRQYFHQRGWQRAAKIRSVIFLNEIFLFFRERESNKESKFVRAQSNDNIGHSFSRNNMFDINMLNLWE
jgi:hypothetical protein